VREGGRREGKGQASKYFGPEPPLKMTAKIATSNAFSRSHYFD